MAKDFADINRMDDEAGLQAPGAEVTTRTKQDITSRFVAMWEKKNAQRALRGGVVSTMALTLAACGDDDDDNGDNGDTDNGDETTAAGTWNLVAGGLQLAGDFDPAIFAGGALPAGVLIGDPSVLTPEQQSNVQGEGLPDDGDDLVLSSTESFLGAEINLGVGEDTVFIDVTGVTPFTTAGLVTNVEIIEIANNGTAGVASNTVNLATVLDVEKVVVSESSSATDGLQVTGIRNTGEIELKGNFNQVTNIDFLNATGSLNLTLDDYFQNNGSMNIAQDFSAINITSVGEGDLNAIDAGTLGANLRNLTIDGDVELEITGAVAFRPLTQAVIDAGGFEGSDLTLTVAAHNDVAFTGSEANDNLTVAPAAAAVGPDTVISLNADFGAGSNMLTIGGAAGFVTPDSSITSDGDLALVINAAIDMSQPDADGNLLDLSDVTSVTMGAFGFLTLTAEQVAQVGIENFSTPDFGNGTGFLNIAGVDGSPLDLSNMDVGTIVNLTTVPGDVVFSEDTVLGNQNAGVAAVIVDNRGTDSTVTMTADQFQQMSGTGTVNALGGTGTNNPATGQPYTTGLILTDVDPDTAYNLTGVTTDTTDVQLTDFTAGEDFAITGAGPNTELTLTLEGAVDLTDVASGNLNVTDLALADGVELTSIGEPTVAGDLIFEGEATLNVVGDDRSVNLNTDNIVGDTSQVTVNFDGTGTAALNVSGSNDLDLKAVNAGPDIAGPVVINNNLDAGATLDIAGGSPAMTLGEDTTNLEVNGDPETTTLIGTDPDNPDIVSSTLTTITTNAGTDAVINLGTLDGVTSDDLTVVGNNDPSDPSTGTTSVEIAEVPAGGAWVFNGVELVINDASGFGADATIKLEAGTTLAGDAAIADILPFLTSDSIFPVDSELTAAEIDDVLQALDAHQATVNATDMDIDQLVAVVDNSLKVDTISGDLPLTADLTPFQINTLSDLYVQGPDDVLTIDADGMSTAQKEASAGAVEPNTNVINLTLDSDDFAGDIATLLADTASNSTVVEAADMSAGQLNALVPEMPNVNVINNMTLTDGNSDTQITALLSKAAPESVTVNAAGMAQAQFASIEEQITKIAVVENLSVTDAFPAEDFQFSALLELAEDATVDATGMSDARLSVVAENIGNIADDGITNLTVTSNQTAAEIEALLGKADSDPAATAQADLSDMDADQVAAVVDNADNVAGLTVGVDNTASLTLAQLAEFDAAGLLPLEGNATTAADETGGSITIIADEDGDLDLTQVAAGASGPGTAGTLTLQIEDGASLSVEGNTASENLAVTGTGTLVVTEPLPLTAQGEPNADRDVSIEGGITVDLAPDSQIWLTAQQMSAFTEDGGTVTKQDFDDATEAEGFIRAFAGEADPGDPQDLSDLDLSLVDVLVLEDGDGTILPSSAAALPAQVGEAYAPTVQVQEDTDWSAHEGFFQADVFVAPDATVSISAATATQSTDAGSSVIGEDATADGETGGSIIITNFEDGENYDLSGTFTPGTDGGFNADAGTFEVSISEDVTLEPGTVLPTQGDAEIVIDDEATLTVNGGSAAENQTANSYEGMGTLNFVDLDGNTVTATDEVISNTFTFEDSDTNVTIDGFEAINVGGFNGRFLFDDSTDPDTLGTMSLNLSDFTTSGTGFDTIPNGSTATDLDGVGVIVVEDGSDPTTLDFSGGNNGEDSQIFFAFEDGSDTQVQYWSDDGTGGGTGGDGIVDTDELTLVASLENTDSDQLGSENFTL